MQSKKSFKIPKGGNQNQYIEEEQTTQWPKEKVQKGKQRSTGGTRRFNLVINPVISYE
jgi:hypothetical protein